MTKFLRIMMVLLLSILMSSVSLAQAPETKSAAGGPRKQLAVIVFSGLGGAVLGLSTLSFYGRPQDRLSNIAVGFAVGVIAGSIVTAYSATSNPDSFYGEQVSFLEPKFMNEKVHTKQNKPVLNLSWNF